MIPRCGDTNTKEEIHDGFKLISLDKEVVLLEQLDVLVNDLSFKDSHVSYLKKEIKAKDAGLDFPTWTEEVFAR